MGVSYIIFGDSFTFPEGEAATNRVHTYAQGLHENGIDVHVICFANNYNNSGDGQIYGINYYHPFGMNPRSNYLAARTWRKLVKYFKAFKIIHQINQNGKIIGINCWTQRLMTQFFIFITGNFYKINVFLERSEHTLRHYQGSFLKRKKGNIITYFETKFCDGIFCISQYLIDFYLSIGMSRQKLLLLPSTVDPGRFANRVEKPLPYSYIGYFGSLTFERDNVDLLIKAFALISAKYPYLHLVLGGFCTETEKKQIENLIQELEINSRVLLLKYLGRQEVINYLIHSDLLVMVRRFNLQTQASFPSKLTEYLATSKPVITSNVGEIPNYLSEGINCYFVKPEDLNSLADKIDYVFTNYEEALLVGSRGGELTNGIFNYKFQAQRIVDFTYSSDKTQ